MKRKIELFMILFLLMGAIIASWKLSELTANVSKEEKKAKKDQVVIVVDPFVLAIISKTLLLASLLLTTCQAILIV